MGDVFRYEKYHGYYGGDEKERKANYADMVSELENGFIFFVFFRLSFS